MSDPDPSAPPRAGAYALSALLLVGWLAYGAWFGSASAYHLEHSDTLGLLYLAERMEWTRPATWFSGFYGPVAIATFKVLGGAAASPRILYWSSFAASSLAMCAVAFRSRRLLGNPWFAPLTLVAVALPGAWHTWSTTACVDVFAAAALALGVALSPSAGARARRWIPAALCVALAGSLRVHTLGFGVPWLLLAALASNGLRASGKGLRAGESHGLRASGNGLRASGNGLRASVAVAVAVAACGLALVPSVVASLSSGHGLYTSLQSFNVYKLVHGVDWRVVGEHSVPASLLGVLLEAPGATLRAYGAALWGNAWALALAAGALLLNVSSWSKESRAPAAGQVGPLAAALGVYVVAASIGDSPRTLVPVVPIAGLLTVFVAHLAVQHIASKFVRHVALCAGVVGVVGLLGAHSSGLDSEASRRNAVNDTLLQVEALLVSELEVGDARQVFTDAHDVFLPTTPPRLPNRPGGWARIDDVGFDAAYPDLCVRDLVCFTETARTAGVRAVVLSSNIGASTPALEHARSLRSAQDGFVPIGMVGDLLIGGIPPWPPEQASREETGRSEPESHAWGVDASRPSGGVDASRPSGVAASRPSGVAASRPSGVPLAGLN